jgi:hypothetical protein
MTHELMDLYYGNQAEIDFAYSYCVLLLRIPPYNDRVTASTFPSFKQTKTNILSWLRSGDTSSTVRRLSGRLT